MTTTALGEIVFSHLSFSYPDAPHPALAIEQLRIPPGSLIALVGASGSGKTTLLRLVSGLRQADSAALTVDGLAVSDLQEGEAPFIPQEFSLFPHLTVSENLAFILAGKPEKEKKENQRLEILLTTLNLDQLRNRLPGELSSGQTKRVAIALALALRPRVMLLDEPTANLDPQTSKRLRLDLLLAQRRQKITVIVVTHNPLEALSLADYVLVLDRGHLAQFGTPHEVYLHPASVQSAQALGEVNLISCRVLEGNSKMFRVEALGRTLEIPGQIAAADSDFPSHGELAVRPEHLLISPLTEPLKQVSDSSGIILDSQYLGFAHSYRIESAAGTVSALVASSQPPLRPGQGVEVKISGENAWLLGSSTR